MLSGYGFFLTVEIMHLMIGINQPYFGRMNPAAAKMVTVFEIDPHFSSRVTQ